MLATVKRFAGPLLLVLAVALFFHRALLGERFYAVDFFQTFVPMRAVLADAWSHGLPLWTNHLGNGRPVIVNPLYGAMYWPNLLWLGSDPARAMTALTVAHFVFGGLGAWVLARRWGMSSAAAWTAGIVLALGGPAVAATAYPDKSWPLAWLPWSIVAFDHVLGDRRLPGIAALAFIWTSMISMGDPIVLAASLAGTGLIAIQELVERRRKNASLPAAARPLGSLAVALAGAAILASPLILAALRYVPSSVRGAGFKAEGIVMWSLHPALLAGTILPGAFGDPRLTGPAGFWATALTDGRLQPHLTGFYIGALGLSLALLGALRRSRYRVVVLVWLGVLLALALGKYGPVYPLLRVLPGSDALRFPMKWILPALLPLALLAGWGVERLAGTAPDPASRRRDGLILLAMLGGVALICVGVTAGLDRTLSRLAPDPTIQIDGATLADHIRHAWVAAATRSALPLALALLALGRRGGRALPIAPAIAALVALDLAFANAPLAPTVPSGFYDRPHAAQAILGDAWGHDRVFVDDFGPYGVGYAKATPAAADASRLHRERLMGYVGAGEGLDLAFDQDTEDFSPTAYARTRALVRSAPLREKLMLLGAAGVSHVVTFHPQEAPLQDPIATLRIGFDRPLMVYRNPFALPRARVVPHLTPYDGDAGFIQAVQSSADELFLNTAFVTSQDLAAAGVPPSGGATERGTASIVRDAGRSLEIDVEGPGGFLVVSDTLVPGWSATVDGRAAPLIRADLAFRAVPVGAGSHRVVMRYEPW